eukprot:490116-Amphidinium_carterae.1
MMLHQPLGCASMQRTWLDYNATSVRRCLDRQCIPAEYGPVASAIISNVIANSAFVNRLAAEHKKTPPQQHPSVNSTGAMEKEAQPVAKKMPKKRVRASEMPPSEEPVKAEKALREGRRKSAVNATVSQPDVVSFTPVHQCSTSSSSSGPVRKAPPPPQYVNTVKEEQSVPLERTYPADQLRCIPFDPQLMVSCDAAFLKRRGVIKLDHPVFYHLATFWRCCVQPLCALQRITPLLAIRRSLDPEIRVPFVPASAPYARMCVVADVGSTIDLRHALSQMGTDFVAFWFITFNLDGFEPADADPDTSRGQSVKQLFSKCVDYIDTKWEIAAVPVGLFLPDAAQFVVLARPFYFTSPIAAGVDVQVLINSCLCDLQVTDGYTSNIVAVLAADKTLSF